MIVDRPDLLPASVARTIAAVVPVLRTLAAIDRGKVVPLPNPVPDYLRAKMISDMQAAQDRYFADPARVERDRILAEAAARRFAEWNNPDLPSPSEQAANALEGKP